MLPEGEFSSLLSRASLSEHTVLDQDEVLPLRKTLWLFLVTSATEKGRFVPRSKVKVSELLRLFCRAPVGFSSLTEPRGFASKLQVEVGIFPQTLPSKPKLLC